MDSVFACAHARACTVCACGSELSFNRSLVGGASSPRAGVHCTHTVCRTHARTPTCCATWCSIALLSAALNASTVLKLTREPGREREGTEAGGGGGGGGSEAGEGDEAGGGAGWAPVEEATRGAAGACASACAGRRLRVGEAASPPATLSAKGRSGVPQPSSAREEAAAAAAAGAAAASVAVAVAVACAAWKESDERLRKEERRGCVHG